MKTTTRFLAVSLFTMTAMSSLVMAAQPVCLESRSPYSCSRVSLTSDQGEAMEWTLGLDDSMSVFKVIGTDQEFEIDSRYTQQISSIYRGEGKLVYLAGNTSGLEDGGTALSVNGQDFQVPFTHNSFVIRLNLEDGSARVTFQRSASTLNARMTGFADRVFVADQICPANGGVCGYQLLEMNEELEPLSARPITQQDFGNFLLAELRKIEADENQIVVTASDRWGCPQTDSSCPTHSVAYPRH